MKRYLLFPVYLGLLLCLTACGTTEPAQSQLSSPSEGSLLEETSEMEPDPSSDLEDSQDESTKTTSDAESEEEDSEMKWIVEVNGTAFTATLEENTAVDALVELMEQGPITIQMSDYAGFEKVGPLGTSLPTSNQQTTTQAGDIVLYQGNQIVIFYGSNTWSYTRLGHIDDLTGWEEALGNGDVTVTFSLED